jgi:hypothetical protein|tara:strand:- start:267 stop:476 length:210 start_codon:yes stop_codon:yes gene_type:complete
MKEGNVISFKVFIDSKGNLMTEYSKLPIEKVTDVFDSSDTPLIRKILRELEPKLELLHSKLENELNALT